MAWIQVDDGIREHDKIYNLADALGISNAHAVGLMVCLWTWAATAAPDGDVTNFPPRAIAKAAGWDKGGAKGAQQFYDDLLSIRFLDKKEDDQVLIRNWEQRATLLIDYIEQQKENTRRRVQKCRDRKKAKHAPEQKPKREESEPPCNSNGNVTETLSNGTTSPIPKSNIPITNLSDNNNPLPSTVEGVTEDEAGQEFGVVCQEFEKRVNPMPSAKDGTTLQELFGKYPVDRILNAINETARCKGRSASYVRSVLQNEDQAKQEHPPSTAPDLTDPERYKNFGK